MGKMSKTWKRGNKVGIGNVSKMMMTRAISLFGQIVEEPKKAIFKM
jgi:hypothetical protein